jgi:hypothetical protein
VSNIHAGRTLLATALAATAVALTGAVAHAGTERKLAPKVATGKPSNVHGTSALLNGVVTPNEIETKHAVIPVKQKTPVKVGQPVVGLAVDDYFEMFGSYVSEGVVHLIHGKERRYEGPRPKKLRFNLPRGKESQITVGYGGSFDLDGSLTGTNASGVQLSLQAVAFPFKNPFTTLGSPVVTSSVGRFVFKVAKMTANTEFRIVTLGASPVYSPTVTVRVSPQIVLHVRSAGKTGLYRLFGTVTPAENGAPLLIQILKPQKASSKKEGPAPHEIGATVLKRGTKTTSRFSIVLSLSGNWHYRAYVRLSAKQSLVSGNSSNVLIKAPKATAKHKRKKKK